jgi:hypothetical protein
MQFTMICLKMKFTTHEIIPEIRGLHHATGKRLVSLQSLEVSQSKCSSGTERMSMGQQS